MKKTSFALVASLFGFAVLAGSAPAPAAHAAAPAPAVSAAAPAAAPAPAKKMGTKHKKSRKHAATTISADPAK